MKTKHFPLEPTQIGPVILIAVISVLLGIFHEALIIYGDYSRSLVQQGELWRLLTGHLFHTNTNHLLLNLAGLFLLWALHGDYYSAVKTTVLFVVCGMGVSLGVHFLTPELTHYVGLSGVLHGFFVWGACEDIRLKRKSGYLLLIGLAIKIVSEQIEGPDATLGGWIDAQVAIDAHLYGALAGFIAFAITSILHKKKGA